VITDAKEHIFIPKWHGWAKSWNGRRMSNPWPESRVCDKSRIFSGLPENRKRLLQFYNRLRDNKQTGSLIYGLLFFFDDKIKFLDLWMQRFGLQPYGRPPSPTVFRSSGQICWCGTSNRGQSWRRLFSLSTVPLRRVCHSNSLQVAP
jgi:hypothetical protein